MSGGGGGGPGSNAVMTPNPGATNIFPDQGQAQSNALAGAGQIANNSFYPMPQVTSFLFPGGVPGSIASEGGQPQYTWQPSAGGAPSTPSGPTNGLGFDTGAGIQTMAPGATPGSFNSGTGVGGGYYGNPATDAQLAEQMFASVQAGGQYSNNPNPSPAASQDQMTPTDMMQMQNIADGSLKSQYITQQDAQQYLQGNYGVANSLAPDMSQIMAAVTGQASQGALAGPSSAPSSAWGPPGGGGNGGAGGNWVQSGVTQQPQSIGSEMNPALAGFLGGSQGAMLDLMGDQNPQDWAAGNWDNPGGTPSQNIGGIFGGGSGTAGQMGPTQGGPMSIPAGMAGGMDPMSGGGGLGGMGPGGLAGPGGAAPGLASGQPGQTFPGLPAQSTAGFGSGASPGMGPTQPGQTGSPIGLNANSAGTQTFPGVAEFTNPFTGLPTNSSQIGTSGFGGLNTFSPTAANFVSPGTQGTGQGAMGSGLNFSYPGAAAFLGLGPQIGASAMDVPSILQGAGGALLNTGFDPQKALYARTQNQNAQQAAANEGNAGLGSTPYGTSVENLNNENFNIDWQNAQEARQAQALSGASGAFQTAQGLQTGGLAALQAGAMGATAQDQQSIQDYLQYAAAATAQNQLPIELYQAEAQAANQAQANSQQASQAGKGQATGLAGSVGSGLGAVAGGK